jgi:hypothetical protein
VTDAPRPLMILVAGLYRSGTGDQPGKLEANVRAMNETALVLFRAGHLPVTGEALALPLLQTAGSTHPGDLLFREIFHPSPNGSSPAATRCRVSAAPRKAQTGWSPRPTAQGKDVYTRLADIPAARHHRRTPLHPGPRHDRKRGHSRRGRQSCCSTGPPSTVPSEPATRQTPATSELNAGSFSWWRLRRDIGCPVSRKMARLTHPVGRRGRVRVDWSWPYRGVGPGGGDAGEQPQAFFGVAAGRGVVGDQGLHVAAGDE